MDGMDGIYTIRDIQELANERKGKERKRMANREAGWS
jgi:hypothetical protein